ncbi:MAG TPA: serine/threonine-protein kinase, partial [Planctomycetota bacterium]|nr:serine/threonine-protein kinase [Planctomycetota bacterium]
MSFAQPFKDYEILERVGAGAMGTVFKARHKKLNRIVALKVLRPSLARDERYVDRLRREARIVASLSHPNVVTGFDLGEEGGYHFFVMEFVEGKSLRALLQEWGMFPEAQVLKVGMQVTSALDHAYPRGIIHRDIKPGNVLIDPAGNIKLTDLGLAKGPTDMTITRDGATVGTPQYISPEQARSPADVDVRSDLYSLGATLYHMATGQPPFRGDSMAEVITKVLHDVAPSPRDLNPALSEGLSLVIRKLLAKDVTRRYQTPRELLDDLERVQRAEAPEVDRVEVERAERGPGPNIALRAAAGLFGVVIVAGAVWFGSQLKSETTVPVRPEEYLALFDREFDAAAAEPAKQWKILRNYQESPPAGTRQELFAREMKFLAKVQEGVNELASTLLQQTDWSQVETWLRDVASWPSADDFELKQLSKQLQQRTGFTRAQLPSGVRRDELDRVLKAVERAARQRDFDLQRDCRHHLDVELQARCDDLLRSSDFAAASACWVRGLDGFLDGTHRPLPQRLQPEVASQLQQAFDEARNTALSLIDSRERAMTERLHEEARTGLQALSDEATAAGADGTLLQGELQWLRDSLRQACPEPARFRVGADPWPDIDRQLDAFGLQVRGLAAAQAARKTDWCIDLAYHALIDGDPEAAVAAVATADLSPAMARHRVMLQAAHAVADAVLRALAKAPASEPLNVFHRSAPMQPVHAEVQLDSGRPALFALVGDRTSRQVRFTELVFHLLLEQARRIDPQWAAGLEQTAVDSGTMVLAMAGDDLSDMAERLRGADGFLVTEVWPRIKRLRSAAGSGSGSVDRRQAITRLQAAAKQATIDGRADGFGAMLRAFRSSFADSLDDGERRDLDGLDKVLLHLNARTELEQQLRETAPSPSRITVELQGNDLVARVTVGAAGLANGAGSAWLRQSDQSDLLAFTPPAADEGKRRLHVDTGLKADVAETTCTIEFVLPPVTVGERGWIFEFRGITSVLQVTGDDMVYAAFVDPTTDEKLKEDKLQKACQRALQPLLGSGRTAPHAIAGGIHRLAIRVAPLPSGRRATATVLFEDVELCSETREFDRRPPTLTID